MPDLASPALSITNLIKDVGPIADLDGRMKRVISDISLTAQFGAVTALLGTNGAGKTTTLECAQGLTRRTGGSITLLGQDPERADAALRARVGVMLQDGGLPPASTPRRLLNHVAGMYRNPRNVAELMAQLAIDEFSATTIRRLSGGQKQRVALGAALIGRPEVLFLDEPSAGLDPQSRQLVFDLIQDLRASGMAIILTTHLLDDAQRLADYVYIIDHGASLAEGTVAELIDSAQQAAGIRTLTFAAPADLTVPALRADIAVHQVRPGNYEVRGELTPSDLAVLASWWERENIMPTALELESKNLEDVFLALAEQAAMERS